MTTTTMMVWLMSDLLPVSCKLPNHQTTAITASLSMTTGSHHLPSSCCLTQHCSQDHNDDNDKNDNEALLPLSYKKPPNHQTTAITASLQQQLPIPPCHLTGKHSSQPTWTHVSPREKFHSVSNSTTAYSPSTPSLATSYLSILVKLPTKLLFFPFLFHVFLCQHMSETSHTICVRCFSQAMGPTHTNSVQNYT